MYFPLQVIQEFILGVYDEEATAAFNQNLSDISTLKDPRSKDASQRYDCEPLQQVCAREKLQLWLK
jgi:hypothetical protein